MRNNKLIFGLGMVVVYTIWNIIVFSLLNDKNAVFWWSYGFTSLGFLVSIIVTYTLFRKGETINDVFFGLPLFQITASYFIVQVIVGTVFIVLMHSVNIKVAIIVQIIVFAAYIVLALGSLLARNVITNTELNVKEKVLFMKLLDNDIIGLQGQANDPALKTRIINIHEMVKFSDPMTHPSLALVEQKISANVTRLKRCIRESNYQEAYVICDEVEGMLADRNRKCKILK